MSAVVVDGDGVASRLADDEAFERDVRRAADVDGVAVADVAVVGRGGVVVAEHADFAALAANRHVGDVRERQQDVARALEGAPLGRELRPLLQDDLLVGDQFEGAHGPAVGHGVENQARDAGVDRGLDEVRRVVGVEAPPGGAGLLHLAGLHLRDHRRVGGEGGGGEEQGGEAEQTGKMHETCRGDKGNCHNQHHPSVRRAACRGEN